MQRDDWSALATFAAIADAGSFTAAAARLGVTPSACSHALRALEARLGLRLLHRTTRSVAPTEAGEHLLATIRPALRDVAGALDRLGALRDQPAGPLRITAHRTAAQFVLMPHLATFASRFPAVTLELAVDDGLVDIVAGRFDAGVRHEQMLDTDMISVRISQPERATIVASPAYLAQAGTPATPDALRTHRCLSLRHETAGTLRRWAFEADGRQFTMDPPTTFACNDPALLVQAALDGMGIATALPSQVAPHLASGALVPLLKPWCPVVPGNHLYYPGRRHVGAALRAFIDTVRCRPTSSRE